ncbi:hypothetical protein AB0M46_05520 [Dactylosporangium sp. NPDC051485]|uniref:hypothetical protein n=1 Tax=Dactylosporangium sp. NPDC051485 TaxID=3154846 RepID=UPI0034451EA4
MTGDPDAFVLSLLVDHLARTRAEAHRTLGHLLRSCLLDLHVATAAATADPDGHPRDLHALTIAIKRCLDTVRADQTTFTMLSLLQVAALNLRFLHREAETADTANPLYNVTDWLLDAISACTTLLRADEALATAASFTTGPPPPEPT